jgi:hypothetical protein
VDPGVGVRLGIGPPRFCTILAWCGHGVKNYNSFRMSELGGLVGYVRVSMVEGAPRYPMGRGSLSG